MKIAFTTEGYNLQGALDPRFGRASRFLIYDSDTFRYYTVDNAVNANAAQGAGIQAAQNILREGVDILITGHIGPKAFKVLADSDIKIYNSVDTTIENALRNFESNKLKTVMDSDVEGHW